MSSADNKALVLALYEQTWNAGNLAPIAERVSLDRIDHDPGGPPAGDVAGRQELIDSVQEYRTAFPDLHFEFGPQVAEDELVATRWTARGTHLGPLDDTPPTGKKVWDLRASLSPFPRPIAGAPLIESGAYRLIRHPIYSGLILLAIGWGMATSSILAIVAAGMLFLLFAGKSRREEVWLEALHPEYRAYRQRTKRLIPNGPLEVGAG